MKRVNRYLDNSFLTDPMKRTTENNLFYIVESSRNISTRFLGILEEDWSDDRNIYKYQLSEKERTALFSERAVLQSGYSHGEKFTMIMLLTGFGGDFLLNLLEKATAKIMVLDYMFGTTVSFDDYLFFDKLTRFEKDIYL